MHTDFARAHIRSLSEKAEHNRGLIGHDHEWNSEFTNLLPVGHLDLLVEGIIGDGSETAVSLGLHEIDVRIGADERGVAASAKRTDRGIDSRSSG